MLLGLRFSGSRLGAGGRDDGAGFADENGIDVMQGTDGGGTGGELDEPAGSSDFWTLASEA
jgi:hypothetical protein